jgi:hypothetical protein
MDEQRRGRVQPSHAGKQSHRILTEKSRDFSRRYDTEEDDKVSSKILKYEKSHPGLPGSSRDFYLVHGIRGIFLLHLMYSNPVLGLSLFQTKRKRQKTKTKCHLIQLLYIVSIRAQR